jgi:hypothetical protein
LPSAFVLLPGWVTDGATLFTVMVAVSVAWLLLLSVARMDTVTVLGPLPALYDGVAPVASSYCPSLSKSQASETPFPLDVALRETLPPSLTEYGPPASTVGPDDPYVRVIVTLATQPSPE